MPYSTQHHDEDVLLKGAILTYHPTDEEAKAHAVKEAMDLDSEFPLEATPLQEDKPWLEVKGTTDFRKGMREAEDYGVREVDVVVTTNEDVLSISLRSNVTVYGTKIV